MANIPIAIEEITTADRLLCLHRFLQLNKKNIFITNLASSEMPDSLNGI